MLMLGAASLPPLFAQSPYTPPVLLDERDIDVPVGLMESEGLSRGHAVVHALVNDEGRVEDSICLEASHAAFCEALESDLRRARFQPATRDGIPTYGQIILKVTYTAEGITVNQTVGEWLSQEISRAATALPATHVASSAELDEPLRIVQEPPALTPVDAQGQVISGEVAVVFYIDRDGTVKLPLVKASTDDRLNEIAAQTFAQTRFAVPTIGGRPVPVRVERLYRVR